MLTANIKSKDIYEFYATQHFKYYKEGFVNGTINKRSKYYLTYSTFMMILSDLNIALRESIVYNSFEFNIPYRLGVLSIKKNKREVYFDKDGKLVNTLPVDWKQTKELWSIDEEAKQNKTLVRHVNKHTGGYVIRWHYNITKANYTNKTVYKFIPCRDAKRLITKALKENDKLDYFEQ